MLSFCSNKLGMRSDASGEYLFQYLIEQGVVPYLMESKQQHDEVWDHLHRKRERCVRNFGVGIQLHCLMRGNQLE